MKSTFRGPVVALAIALAVILIAITLDRGSAESRDAALLVGSLGLYLLLPLAVIWLIVALVIWLRRDREEVPGRRSR